MNYFNVTIYNEYATFNKLKKQMGGSNCAFFKRVTVYLRITQIISENKIVTTARPPDGHIILIEAILTCAT